MEQLAHPDEISEARPPSLTADEVFEIARRGALAALEAAGLISKKDKALAIVGGSIAGITVTTANSLAKPTPKLEKREPIEAAAPQPVAEPKPEAPAPKPSATPTQGPLSPEKWKAQISQLPMHDADAWQRHYLILRDDLRGLSGAQRQALFVELFNEAFKNWVDYDEGNGGRFLPSPEFKQAN